MSKSLNIIIEKIEQYKRKFYKNQLIKGLIISLGLVLSLFLFINSIEYFGRFGSGFRAFLLLGFVLISLYTLIFLLAKPILYFLKIKSGVSNEDAAADIGKFFPEIGDRLINTLQLSSLSSTDNSLLLASIEQKSKNLSLFQFADAINISENKKYLKYLVPPLVLILFISAISPNFFKSSERILKFSQTFEEEAPFKFIVENKDLNAFRNEDFLLKLRLDGDAIPDEVYLVYNERRFRKNATPDNANLYTYEFSKLQNNLDFNFLASGFQSKEYELNLLNRPELLSFDVIAQYPAYLNKKSENLQNVGNLVVPEGTKIQWVFNTKFADSLAVIFGNNEKQIALQKNANEYVFEKKMLRSEDYKILVKNNSIQNDENISYYINVVSDEFPSLQLDQIKDTTLYQFIAIGGNIQDDYGFSNFKFNYRSKNDPNPKFTQIPISFNKGQLSQSYYFQFDLNKLKLNQDDELQYFLEVWDNDGVNGAKSTKSPLMTFGLPSSTKFNQEIDKEVEDTENKMMDLLKKSKEIKNSLEKLDNKLKSKKDVDYQDKKQIEELLKKKEQLLEDLNALQRQFDQMQEKQNRFQEQSPEIQKKLDQLQQLINDITQDEKTEAFEKMKELLEQNESDKVIEQLEKMKKEDRNLDRDLDRTLKLFKELQLKQKVERLSKDLEQLAEKQEELGEKTQENKNPEENKNLVMEQEKLTKEFNEKKKDILDIKHISQELRKDIDENKSEQKEISEEQKKAEDQLNKNQNNDAAKSQKKAAKAMKKMAEGMSQQMQSAEMKQLDLDIEALREILENLVKLSFDQEEVMNNFKGLSPSDPRFVPLSQQQLKLVDDAKVIEDSLYSLAQTVMQIEAMVTKEVKNMKNNMDQSLDLLKERKLPQATAKQQFSMTSINNLALMLSDTFSQLQNMMANAKPGGGSKKSGNLPLPGLGEQQGKLNQRMEGLGKSGKSGSELSKELAQMANEQAKIRKQIQELQEQLNGTKEGQALGNELKKIEQEMDKTEENLVNKRLNPALIKRQENIETRLLEVEKAMKEQGLDPKRKAKTAPDIKAVPPASLEKYIQNKQKQMELIKTTPPSFTPFFKQHTDNYFKSLN